MEFNVDWHIFTIIYNNDNIYVIQSFIKEYGIRIDNYKTVEEVVNLLIDIYDCDNHEVLQKFLHLNNDFGLVNNETTIFKNRISFKFQQLIIPGYNEIKHFLNKYNHISKDINMVEEYNFAVKTIPI